MNRTEYLQGLKDKEAQRKQTGSIENLRRVIREEIRKELKEILNKNTK
jgi:predicted component of type VI protein secretion system